MHSIHSMTGKTVSRYHIVGPLRDEEYPSNYRAEDIESGQPVALKFLPPKWPISAHKAIPRDYLRANPNAQQKYAELKCSLADNFRDDREAYTEAKGIFIKSIETAFERSERRSKLFPRTGLADSCTDRINSLPFKNK